MCSWAAESSSLFVWILLPFLRSTFFFTQILQKQSKGIAHPPSGHCSDKNLSILYKEKQHQQQSLRIPLQMTWGHGWRCCPDRWMTWLQLFLAWFSTSLCEIFKQQITDWRRVPPLRDLLKHFWLNFKNNFRMTGVQDIFWQTKSLCSNQYFFTKHPRGMKLL